MQIVSFSTSEKCQNKKENLHDLSLSEKQDKQTKKKKKKKKKMF